MVKKKTKSKKQINKKTKKLVKSKVSQTTKIVGLIINVLILPGLGTLIAGGKTKNGIWQLTLTIGGGLLSLFLIGIPFVIAGWIWALIDSIKLLEE